jgi:hypothetical protein
LRAGFALGIWRSLRRANVKGFFQAGKFFGKCARPQNFKIIKENDRMKEAFWLNQAQSDCAGIVLALSKVDG